MRDLQECRAEVFRRSEERIKEGKKRRRMALMVLLPPVLCITVFGGFLLSNRGMEKSSDCAAPESAMGTFCATAGEIIAEGALAETIEVTGKGLAQLHTSSEEVGEIIGLMDKIRGIPKTGSLSESEDLSFSQSTSKVLQDETLADGYRILIRHGDGTATEFWLRESTLWDPATQETFLIDTETYRSLRELLGITSYESP